MLPFYITVGFLFSWKCKIGTLPKNGYCLVHLKMSMGIDNWVEMGSATDLEK